MNTRAIGRNFSTNFWGERSIWLVALSAQVVAALLNQAELHLRHWYKQRLIMQHSVLNAHAGGFTPSALSIFLFATLRNGSMFLISLTWTVTFAVVVHGFLETADGRVSIRQGIAWTQQNKLRIIAASALTLLIASLCLLIVEYALLHISLDFGYHGRATTNLTIASSAVILGALIPRCLRVPLATYEQRLATIVSCIGCTLLSSGISQITSHIGATASTIRTAYIIDYVGLLMSVTPYVLLYVLVACISRYGATSEDFFNAYPDV